MKEPRVSIVIPVHNGGPDLKTVLDSVSKSSYPYHECIIVDDASTDGMTQNAAESIGAQILWLEHQHGPSAARNRGVEESSGDILFFIDADVRVHRDTIEKGVQVLQREPDIAAVFGSYDDDPGHATFISKYRNLYHHWIHQTAHTQASTFWTGCGAIRRTAFDAVGGFDTSFSRPSIEDIEFGGRLRLAGYDIQLENKMQCQHLKRWTLSNVITTDVFQRGIPWMTLLLESGEIPNDLNISYKSRLATVLAGLLALFLVGLPLAGQFTALLPSVTLLTACAVCSLFALGPRVPAVLCTTLTLLTLSLAIITSPLIAGLIPIALIMTIAWTQIGFYRLVANKHNLAFAFAVIPMQVIFFLGCAVSAAAGYVIHYFGKIRGLAAR